MPFETDIVKLNLTDGYILKAYALLGFGKFQEAENCIREAEKYSTYDFRIIVYKKIAGSIK